MNKNLIRRASLALVAGLISLQPLARAAEPTPRAANTPSRQALVRERLRTVAKELNLTQEQKEQMKPLLRAQAEKLRELVQDGSLTRDQKVEQLKAMRREMAPKVKAILTPEQYAKWSAMRDEWRQKLQARRQKRSPKA